MFEEWFTDTIIYHAPAGYETDGPLNSDAPVEWLGLAVDEDRLVVTADGAHMASTTTIYLPGDITPAPQLSGYLTINKTRRKILTAQHWDNMDDDVNIWEVTT